MTYYVKTELSPDGIANITGSFQKVNGRGNASELSYADAQYFQRQAFQNFPGLAWEIEHVREGKYLVKAEG
jgi:hypothetical protein